MGRLRYGVLAVALGTIALGCEVDSGEDWGYQEAQAEPAPSFAAVGEAFCTAYYGCGCQQPTDTHDSIAECRLHVTTAMTRHLLEGRDAGLDYDSACLQDVAAWFSAAECADATDVALDESLRGALDLMLACKPYSGGGEEGDSCMRLATAKGDDCRPGLACDEAFDVCVPAALGVEGALCGSLSPACGPGLSCVPDSDGGETCGRLPELGGACPDGLCGTGAWCDAGRCEALPGAGEPCVDGGNALQWGCERGAMCSDGQCVAAPGYLQPCEGTCAAGLFCAAGVCSPTDTLVCDLESALP